MSHWEMQMELNDFYMTAEIDCVDSEVISNLNANQIVQVSGPHSKTMRVYETVSDQNFVTPYSLEEFYTMSGEFNFKDKLSIINFFIDCERKMIEAHSQTNNVKQIIYYNDFDGFSKHKNYELGILYDPKTGSKFDYQLNLDTLDLSLTLRYLFYNKVIVP